jgi:hypothetical protein
VANPTVPREAIVANLNYDMALPLFPLRSVLMLGAEQSSIGDSARAVGEALNLPLSPDPFRIATASSGPINIPSFRRDSGGCVQVRLCGEHTRGSTGTRLPSGSLSQTLRRHHDANLSERRDPPPRLHRGSGPAPRQCG